MLFYLLSPCGLIGMSHVYFGFSLDGLIYFVFIHQNKNVLNYFIFCFNKIIIYFIIDILICSNTSVIKILIYVKIFNKKHTTKY